MRWTHTRALNALTSSHGVGSLFDILIQDCQLLASSLDNIVFSLVSRSANSVAHTVARVSGSLSGLMVWDVVAPDYLLSSLRTDRY